MTTRPGSPARCRMSAPMTSFAQATMRARSAEAGIFASSGGISSASSFSTTFRQVGRSVSTWVAEANRSKSRSPFFLFVAWHSRQYCVTSGRTSRTNRSLASVEAGVGAAATARPAGNANAAMIAAVIAAVVAVAKSIPRPPRILPLPWGEGRGDGDAAVIAAAKSIPRRPRKTKESIIGGDTGVIGREVTQAGRPVQDTSGSGPAATK